MTIDGEQFAAARRASGITLERAANICGIARQTLQNREEKAETFRLSELIALYEQYNEPGKRILREAICSIFF